MKVLRICQRAADILEDEISIEGKVFSVFNNACNILLPRGDILTLINANKQIAPMSMTVNLKVGYGFPKLGLVQNNTMTLTREFIQSKESAIYFDLRRSVLWDSCPYYNYSRIAEEELAENIDYLYRVILQYGNLNGIAPYAACILNKLGDSNNGLEQISVPKGTEFILDRLFSFIETFVNGDKENINIKAKSIIGFGAGLTPAMDDYISGLMISMIYLANYYSQSNINILEMNSEIIRNMENRTTKISFQMLKFSSAGEVSENIKNFIVTMLSSKNKTIITEKLINVMKFGETSGTDTALGIYTGCRIFINKKYRRQLINGG